LTRKDFKQAEGRTWKCDKCSRPKVIKHQRTTREKHEQEENAEEEEKRKPH